MINSIAFSSAVSIPAVAFKLNGSSGESNGKYRGFNNASSGGYPYYGNVIDSSSSLKMLTVNKPTSNTIAMTLRGSEGNDSNGASWDEATAQDLMLTSEQVLAKLWLTDEEDEAWAHLHTLPEVL